MDRWRAEVGRVREEKSRREKIRKEKEKKEDAGALKGRKVGMRFFPCFGSPEGRKVGLLKRRVRRAPAR